MILFVVKHLGHSNRVEDHLVRCSSLLLREKFYKFVLVTKKGFQDCWSKLRNRMSEVRSNTHVSHSHSHTLTHSHTLSHTLTYNTLALPPGLRERGAGGRCEQVLEGTAQ